MAVRYGSGGGNSPPPFIVVPSVHHTGTKFVYEELLNDLAPGERKLRMHCEDRFREDLHMLCSMYPAIVPLRHPRTMAEGWKTRGKSLDELNRQWLVLEEEVDFYDPYYLPLDSPDRDRYLTEINKALKLSMRTDWSNKWSNGLTAILDKEDERKVKIAMSTGFFERFGYE